eukprot:COSAG02_NODE_2797_length_8012_cov_3.512827_7_plen_57_part_00
MLILRKVTKGSSRHCVANEGLEFRREFLCHVHRAGEKLVLLLTEMPTRSPGHQTTE